MWKYLFENPEVVKYLEKIIEIHSSIKGLILYTEEIAGLTNPQALLETRDALDHILRALRAELEKKVDIEYEKANLDKAVGHLCRGGYDVLDWASLVIKINIQFELKEFSTDTISKVIPNYYSELKPKILKISTEIAEIRESKDVGKLTLEEFTKYFTAVLELQEMYKEVIDKKASLIEVEKDVKNKKRLKWIIPTVTTVIGVILTYLITKFF